MAAAPRARALLVVPPLLKYSAGPLLGPALLVAAARAAGHDAEVLDLSIRWIREHLLQIPGAAASPFVGDHDKPGALLSSLQRDVFTPLLRAHLTDVDGGSSADPHLTLTCSHDAVDEAVVRLAGSSTGRWIRDLLAQQPRPDVLGVSVLFSGQVLLGLATSYLARALWPGIQIVWGGPHVTALQDRIAREPRFGRFVDAFVFGYAERTFVGLLDAVALGAALPQACVRPGSGEACRATDDASYAPSFQDLDLYGIPHLTLPAQASRGCSYGRCEFCTYPAIEGEYRPLDEAVIEPVIALAATLRANVAFKDSLLLPKRLFALADRIAGRARWSACTKLSASLDADALRRLRRGGCATLEVGLETIDPEHQRLIAKKQSVPLFLRTLDAAAEAEIGLVINYITGFPGQDPATAARELDWLREEIARRPGLQALVEHNEFQLERLSPMVPNARSHGLAVTGEWPWSSVLGWRMVAEEQKRTRLQVVTQ